MIDSPSEYLRAFCLSSSLNFVKYFFYSLKGRKFVCNSHHKKICEALDDVIAGNTRKLIINVAPRYSKTELAVKNFIAYGLAVNPASKFIHLSYSDDLAHDNSEEVRDIVKSDAFKTLFPYVSIKQDSDSKKKWLTTAGGGVYATATGGQVTGFGAGEVDDYFFSRRENKFCGAIVIDDPMKPEDALSQLRRERVNSRFENTIRSRVNSRNTPIVIIMQRLHEDDLCGYLTKTEPGEWRVLSLPAIVEDGGVKKPLWAFKHTLEELESIRKSDPFVFESQYMQNPVPKSGLMYTEFKEYKDIPVTVRAVKKNYTDTADTGKDYLCSINYIETEVGNYITDVEYTQDGMCDTEQRVARMIHEGEVEVVNIESNNGGGVFARNVEKSLRQLGNYNVVVNAFHQSKNKDTRIFSNANIVQNIVYYPENWEHKFPNFARALKSYMKTGGNAHDDAPDALTGTVEKRDENNIKSFDWKEIEYPHKFVVEIHPVGFEKVVIVKGFKKDGNIYITYAYSGENLSNEELRSVCTESDVQMEVSRDLSHILCAFRKNVCRCWGRELSSNIRQKVEEYMPYILSNVYFVRSKESRMFTNKMLLNSAVNVNSLAESYAVACLCMRLIKNADKNLT